MAYPVAYPRPTLWPTGGQIFKSINTTLLRVEPVRSHKLLSLEKGVYQKVANTIFNVRGNETVQIVQHSALKPPISLCLGRIPQPI